MMIIDKQILDLLTDFAVFLDDDLDEGDVADEVEASKRVDKFIASLPKSDG